MDTLEDRMLMDAIKRLRYWYKNCPDDLFIRPECRIIVKWIANKYGPKFVKDIADAVLDGMIDELGS